MKQHAPAAARNREPIREVLARHLPAAGTSGAGMSGAGMSGAGMSGAGMSGAGSGMSGAGLSFAASPARFVVLEIASGTGEHAVHMARAFPHLDWQPTDPDETALASIAAWRDEVSLPNLRAPIRFDVRDASWPSADVIVCINMIHIAPWEASLALFAGAARTLASGSMLFTYGPYRFDGKTAPSNDDFDRSLKSRDSRWGVRDVTELKAIASGFVLEEAVAMPANNHSLIWRRR